MAVSGIVIHLSEHGVLREKALSLLSGNACVTLGEINGLKQPAVLDTPSTRQDRACWSWIKEVPGVTGLDLICVHYDQSDHDTTALGDGTSERGEL